MEFCLGTDDHPYTYIQPLNPHPQKCLQLVSVKAATQFLEGSNPQQLKILILGTELSQLS